MKNKYKDATYDINGEEADIYDKDGNYLDTVDLNALVQLWLDKKGYEKEVKI